MKKAFSTKLVALFVLVLTVAALVVVSSAAQWDATDTPGYIVTGDIVGATIEVKSIVPNGMPYFAKDQTVVFDVKINDGYMIDDDDLHDNYFPLEPVVYAKTHNADGSFTRVVIEKVEKGENAGYYVINDWTADCDIEVECVSAKVITLTGANYEDLTFEQDGHVYVLDKVANYADIVILNSITDYTKAVLSGCEVDDYGHITDVNKKAKSYFATIQATGTFANMEGATLTFAYGQGTDGANQAGDVSKATMVSEELWYVGSYLIFSKSGSDFVNRGVINVEAQSVYMGCKALINYGEVNVTYSSHLSNAVAKFYVLGNLTNNEGAVINVKAGQLCVGGAYDYSYVKAEDGSADLVAATVDKTLTNKATINLQGTLTVTKTLKNEATGVITASSLTYVNSITGKDANVAPSLTVVNAAKDSESYNYGTIDMTSSVKAAKFVVVNFKNTGSLTIKIDGVNDSVFTANDFTNTGKVDIDLGVGDGVKATINGLLKNSGEFKYFDEEGVFTLNYNGKLVTNLVDVNSKDWEEKVWNKYTTVLRWSGVYNSDSGKGEITGHTGYGSLTAAMLGDFSGINNSGTMSITGVSRFGSWKDGSQFVNNGGRIYNTGDLTINKLFKSVALTKMTRAETDGNGHGWYNWTFIENCTDIINKGTLTLGGLQGHDAYAPYLLNEKGATLNLNGNFYVGATGKLGQTYDRRSFNVDGDDDGYNTEAEFINYGTVNVNRIAIVYNYGNIFNGGLINLDGKLENFNYAIVEKDGEIVVNGLINNGDADHVCDPTIVECDHVGYLEIIGTITNNSKIVNDWGSDIRICKGGTLDNVNGTITNCGLIVNVGTFTTTVEGLDNQFAINGYDVTFVNKAETNAPAADDKDDTKDDADNNAADTKEPTKTPAAQTSDIAVAGLAIIATLSLAGVVVAKKVR